MEENKGKSAALDIVLQNTKDHFKTGVSKKLSFRRYQLKQLLKGLKEMESEILLSLKLDLKRSDYLSKIIEFDHLIIEINSILSNLSTWTKDEKVPTPMFMAPGWSSVHYEPLGVALIMSAWNYPFMGAISPLANAIAAGNMAVIKPSEVAKSSSAMVKKLVERYLDNKAFKVIEGDAEVAKEIITKPFDLIVFTGSPEKGKIVASEAGKNLTPCILELGGKSPCIVDKCANLAFTANRVLFGRFANSGQTCVAPDYVLVHEDVADDFKTQLVQALKDSFSGKSEKYLDNDKGAIINDFHVERVKGYLTENHGGKVLFGVKTEDGLKDIKSNWIPPTVVDDPSLESAIMTEEIFGPILPIVTFNKIDDAIKFVNDRPKPLTIYYFGCVFRGNAKKVKYATSSGQFVQNEVLFQAIHPHLPFGGVGNSGYGSYHGIYGFRNMSHAKACLVKGQLNFFPFTAVNMPFTNTKKMIVKTLLKYGQIGQKQLFRRLIQLLILVWLIRGFTSGRFQKKWRAYKPMIMMVWGMVKPKFLRR